MREDGTLAANACGFGSARSVDERCLFEAVSVLLAEHPLEANAKREQHPTLKTGLSMIMQSPAGPNDQLSGCHAADSGLREGLPGSPA